MIIKFNIIIINLPSSSSLIVELSSSLNFRRSVPYVSAISGFHPSWNTGLQGGTYPFQCSNGTYQGSPRECHNSLSYKNNYLYNCHFVIIREIIFLHGFLLNLVCLRLKFKLLKSRTLLMKYWNYKSIKSREQKMLILPILTPVFNISGGGQEDSVKISSCLIIDDNFIIICSA